MDVEEAAFSLDDLDFDISYFLVDLAWDGGQERTPTENKRKNATVDSWVAAIPLGVCCKC
jgi:hypothetical protein